ncbi:MAG: hypothetical protein GY699_08915 [Desulfobacteraceae bacterium]|nr:hypothetical protein [Desulfobacteraceae bacterium]
MAQKKESKFYIAKTIKDARKKIETKIKTVNEKYVKKQLENGREFFSELKSDPIKRIDDLIDDSKDALNKTKDDRFKAWQKAAKTAKTDARKRFKKINIEGKKVYKGIENDAKLLVDDFIEISKKNIERIPMKKTIEKKIASTIESIPSKLNLPSKDEIDNLVSGIDGVNKKVDALNKQYANA